MTKVTRTGQVEKNKNVFGMSIAKGLGGQRKGTHRNYIRTL